MTTLIADSGSTKTDWCTCNHSSVQQRLQTQGINPFHQSPQEIADIIHQMAKQITDKSTIQSIEFYGAGCALPEKQQLVEQALRKAFPECRNIRIESDLVGAARAVCQGKPGIACIMGTGSNSCQFDGDKIVATHPA